MGTSVFDLISSGILFPKMVGWNLTQIQTDTIRFEEEFRGQWFDVGIHPICNPLGKVVKYAVLFMISPAGKRSKNSPFRMKSFSVRS